MSVPDQICSYWLFFGVCPGLPCLVPFSAHTFPCSVWLCMPCPGLLAQDATVHHRKLSLLARFLSVTKPQTFHSDKVLDSSQWTFLRVFSAVAKNQCDWPSEDLINSIKHGTPGSSPVDVVVAAGDDGGWASAGSEFWEGRPPRNRDFYETFPKISFSIFSKLSHRIPRKIRICG